MCFSNSTKKGASEKSHFETPPFAAVASAFAADELRRGGAFDVTTAGTKFLREYYYKK